MTALVTGASGGLGSSIAKSLAAQGARLAVSGSNVEKLESLPFEPRRRSCRSAVQPVGRRGGRPARSAGGRGAWRQARHPRQQCRRHPRQSPHANEGRGVRGRHPHQPRSCIPPDAGSRQADDEGAVRTHHLDHIGRGRHGQSRPGELCRLEGGPDRHDQGGGSGAREPRNHRRTRSRLASWRQP